MRVAYLVTEGRRLQDGELQVFDVWESQAAFDAFGQTLMPILQEVGVDPGQPMVERIHVING